MHLNSISPSQGNVEQLSIFYLIKYIYIFDLNYCSRRGTPRSEADLTQLATLVLSKYLKHTIANGGLKKSAYNYLLLKSDAMAISCYIANDLLLCVTCKKSYYS